MNAIKLGLAFGVAILASVGAAQAQQVVKAGHEYSPPLYYIDANTYTQTGAMVDAANAVAKDAGFVFEWHVFQGADRLALHAANIFAASVGLLTPERSAVLDVSDAIYSAGDALFVKKSDPTAYKTLEEFKGEVITAGSALADQLRKTGVFKDVLSPPAPDNYRAVISGQAKAGFVNLLALSVAITSYPELRIVPTYEPRFSNPGGIMLNKGQADLLKKINASIAKLKADGSFKAIFAKYGIESAVVK
jgi:polar amino acid transport system substrate-binding protein